jgi:GxxExxY protein
MVELIHKELSYKIVGILYDVYNKLGPGYQEKYYQKAVKMALAHEKIPYLEQVRADLDYKGKSIGRYYMDFVIDHKIVLELKISANFSGQAIRQVLGYLQKSGLELGILASFGNESLKFKRILRGQKKVRKNSFKSVKTYSRPNIREPSGPND